MISRYWRRLSLLLIVVLLGAGHTEVKAQLYPKHKYYSDTSKAKFYDKIFEMNEYAYSANLMEHVDSVFVIAGLSDLILQTDLKDDMESPDWWIAKCLINRTFGSIRSALEDASIALSKAPKYAWGHYNMAMMYLSAASDNGSGAMDTLSLALKHLDKALALDEHSHFYVLRCKILNHLNKPEEAQLAAEKALDLDSNSAFAFIAQYEADARSSTSDQNLLRVNRLIRFFPDIHKYKLDKCNFFLEAGMVDSFFATYQDLSKYTLPPNAKRAYSICANQIRSQALKDQVFECYALGEQAMESMTLTRAQKLMDDNGGKKEYYYFFAKAYLNQGDIHQAMRYFQKVPLKKSVGAFYSLSTMTSIYQGTGKQDSAKYTFGKLQKLFDNIPELAQSYANFLAASEEKVELIKFCEKASKKFPTIGDFDYLIAKDHFAKNEIEKAHKHVMIATNRDPNLTNAWALMAAILNRKGNPRACDIYRIAKDLSIKNNTNIMVSELEFKCIGPESPTR